MVYFRRDLYAKQAVNVNVPHLKNMMCLNESSLDPFLVVKEQFLKLMDKIHLNRYYNEINSELFYRIAEYAGVDTENLILGNGADELLYYLFTAVRENCSAFALSLYPSYFDYQSYCNATGLYLKNIMLASDFSFDVDRFIEESNHPDCRLVILCNPNNPTGNLFPYQDLTRIIISNPDRLVLIDETYFEFSDVTFADKINDFDNLVIIRSFSKAFSAAGLRFGYLISNQDNINQLKKVVTAFNLSIFTQAMACTIIKNSKLFLEYNKNIIDQREMMFDSLNKLPDFIVFKSFTNFLLFRHKYSIDLFNYLIEKDIALRYSGNEGVLKDCLRVSIADEEMNDVFLKKLAEFRA